MNVKTADSLIHRCMLSVRELGDEWQRFWFKPADPFTLGLIRVLTGLMLTYNLLVWGLDLHAFFGVNGLQPLSAITALYSDALVYSFLNYVPNEWLTSVHCACVVVALLFTFGLLTRVTSLAAFVIAVSYSQRVPIANFGLDQILGLLCLYLAIGPSGAALSLDQWIRNRRAKKAGKAISVEKLPAAQMAIRLIQIHVCVIYFWAGFAKLKGDSWWTGEAMWQVMANLEYQTIDLTWMARVPWLPYLVAHVTVAWEVFFCVLIWNRTLRPFMLGIGTLMHLGIGAFLGMWTFGLVMTFPYLAFARPSRWRRLAIWRTSQPDGETEGFADPMGEPDFEPEHEDEELEVESSESSNGSVRGESSDEDIIGGDHDSQPNVVIDYRNTSGGVPVETRAIDDDYVVNASMPGQSAEEKVADAPTIVEPQPVVSESVTTESMEPEPITTSARATDEESEISLESSVPSMEHSVPDSSVDESSFDSDFSQTGAVMSQKPKNPEPDAKELSTRMERIKPKSANSLTGAPAPKIDGRVEESVLAPETEVMLIALHAPERNTFRTYLRRHDIPCRAAISAENAVSTVLTMKPAAVLLSGSCMNPEEIITLVDDLNDMIDAPILALLTLSQIKLLSNDPLSAHVLQYPASLRQIREELTNILLEEGNAKPRCSLRAALSGD